MSNPAFISNLGRHSAKSIGADVGLQNIAKAVQKQDMSKIFAKGAETMTKLHAVGRTLRVGTNVITGTLPNNKDSVAHKNSDFVPFVSKETSQSLGKAEARYYKTNVHVGKPHNKRLKSIANDYQVMKLTKSTADSEKDYLQPKKRKLLRLNGGFNEKGFSFGMADTYFSVADYYKFFEVDKLGKIFENNEDGRLDIYGGALKTKNRFKFKNLRTDYSLHLNIHLIKITDLHSDVEELLKSFLHHKDQDSFLNSGKIPSDFQYTTDPKFDSPFVSNFLTDLSCSLTSSTRFNEKAKIVRTWSKTLPASSIWEFNLTNHLGKGIHLNTVYDLYNEKNETCNSAQNRIEELLKDIERMKPKKNLSEKIQKRIIRFSRQFGTCHNEHPSSYIFAFEYVGDRRATARHKETDSRYTGYSPTDISVEFHTKIDYLSHEEKGLSEEPITYKISRQEQDFNSGYADLFCPDREKRFHIDMKDIGIKGKYELEFDQVLGNTPDIDGFLQNLKSLANEVGVDPSTVNPDDKQFNFKTPPASSSDYNGPAAMPPVLGPDPEDDPEAETD